MNKEVLQQLILGALSKKLGDGYSIHIHEVFKTNIKLDGLTILRKGDHISPTIYLEPYYRAMENGKALDNIINEIRSLYFSTRIEMLDFDVSPIRDFRFVKKRLFVQLINRHRNTELLTDVPHELFLDDFAVIVRCLIDSTDAANTSFLVHNSHLKMWKMESGELLTIAVENTGKIFGADLKKMSAVLKEICPNPVGGGEADIPDVPLWVLTNRKQFFGAAAVLFDDLLQDFASTYGNFYVIFSSVHEALLLPAKDTSDIDFLTAINQSVNNTQVQTDEILGTKAYFYSKEYGFACKGK